MAVKREKDKKRCKKVSASKLNQRGQHIPNASSEICTKQNVCQGNRRRNKLPIEGKICSSSVKKKEKIFQLKHPGLFTTTRSNRIMGNVVQMSNSKRAQNVLASHVYNNYYH